MFLASTLISDKIPPVKTSDPAYRVLDWMNEFKVEQLPVVNAKSLLGIISESDVLEIEDMNQPVGDIQLSLPANLSVYSSQHVFDVLKQMEFYKLDVLPVLDKNSEYLGLISRDELLQGFAKLFSISEPGGIMVLEMLEKDYSLAQISRIIEAEDAKIIALFVNRSFDNTQLNVTIKLNVSELTRITASLQRMNYQVIMSFFDKTQLDDTKDRYDLLMRFLNT